jgi:hypothetical protein
MDVETPQSILSSLLRLPSSGYSSLQEYQVPQMTKIFLSIQEMPRLIVDATAHIGGDTITLSKIYPDAKIIAYDIDLDAIKCLRINVEKYAPQPERVEIIHGDSSDLILKISEEIDILYFDPPWGGPSYSTQHKVPLHLSGKPVDEIIKNILAKKLAKNIILKAPRNFAYSEFKNSVNANMELHLVRKPQQQGKIAYYLIHIFPKITS